MQRRHHQPEDLGLRIALSTAIGGSAALAPILFSMDARLLPLVGVTAGPALYLAHRVHQAAALRATQDDRDGWMAQVSHDLRTPLTPIKGFLHTLQRGDEQFTPQDRQRFYEVMIREEQRLEDLLSSLTRQPGDPDQGPERSADGAD